jgi:hypothetical protein
MKVVKVLMVTLFTILSTQTYAQVITSECSVQALKMDVLTAALKKLTATDYLVSEILDTYSTEFENHEIDGVEDGEMLMLRPTSDQFSFKGAPLIYSKSSASATLSTISNAAYKGYNFIAIKKSCLNEITNSNLIEGLEATATVDMGLGGPYHAFELALSCDIMTIADAQACMDKVALTHIEYNLPSIGSASTQKETLAKVLKALGKTIPSALADADYVGVMLEAGDEWHLYYYSFKKGSSQKPVELASINLVDLEYDLISPVTVLELILGDINMKFDAEDRSWIQEYLNR